MRGGILAFFMIVILIALSFAGSLAYFLHKEDYLRFEYGPPPKVEDRVTFDENTVKQLQQKDVMLQKKEIQLARKQEHINKLMLQFDVQKKTLEKEREEISSHLNKIESFFTQFSEEEEENLKKLARVYESMKAVKVATIFDELDKNTVAELLARMNNRSSSKILAELGQQNAKRAAEISNIMQGKEKSEAFETILQ